MNLCDPKTIRKIMSVHGIGFRKELGQNFLTDSTTVDSIADACLVSRDATVLETGPGIGTLTRSLAARFRRVVALEVDRNLIPVLEDTLGDCGNVQVIQADVLQADLAGLLAADFAAGPVAVCANLPYYITTPILMKLLESRLPFQSITVMVQDEVASRLCAQPGSRAYGAVTASVSYFGQAQKLFTVPASRFLPTPKVNSAVVHIVLWRQPPCQPRSEEMLFRTIKAAFGQRRKTLPNALAAGFPELNREQIRGAVAHIGQPLNVRGECLDIAQFTALSDYILDCLTANRTAPGAGF